MTTTIYLMRSGSTSWGEEGRLLGRKDIFLSEQGRRQIESMQRVTGFSDVLASPLNRASETAEIVSDIGVARDPRLTDVDWGDLEGASAGDAETNEALRTLFDGGEGAIGGESLAGIVERMRASMEHAMVDNPDNSKLLFVSHSIPLRLAIADCLGMPLHHALRIQLDYGGVAVLSCDEGTGFMRLIAINSGETPRPGHILG